MLFHLRLVIFLKIILHRLITQTHLNLHQYISHYLFYIR